MFASDMRRQAVGHESAQCAAIARNLANFLARSGMTQAELAERAGIRRATINSVVRSGRADLQTLEAIAGVFKVPASAVMEMDEHTALAHLLARAVADLHDDAQQFFRILSSKSSDDRIRPTEERLKKR